MTTPDKNQLPAEVLEAMLTAWYAEPTGDYLAEMRAVWRASPGPALAKACRGLLEGLEGAIGASDLNYWITEARVTLSQLEGK